MYDQAGNWLDEKGDSQDLRVAVFCVGNRLHQDDGLGPAVYDAVLERFDVPENVLLFDVGVMTMDLIQYVDLCDAIITVDAVDETGEPAGTIFRYAPEDMARPEGYVMSLHDMKLADLFDAAVLLDYHAQGICLGMQVLDLEPQFLTSELTKPVQKALPQLVEALAAELAHLGCPLLVKETGEPYLG